MLRDSNQVSGHRKKELGTKFSPMLALTVPKHQTGLNPKK